MPEKKISFPSIPIKTNVYIDGYNLYYGCLKRTDCKWLDLEKLFFDRIFPTISFNYGDGDKKYHFEKNGESCIKFFTAEISAKISESDESLASQRSYHRALESNKYIQLIKGSYSVTIDFPFKPHPDGLERPNEKRERVEALKVEEKQTDVNIALHAYHDAITDHELDMLVFVTNDTDLVPALRFIREYTDKAIGLVTPSRDRDIRRTNSDLSKLSNWTRTYIVEDELKASQLPRVIQSKRTPIRKPESWYPNPDIFVQIISTLKEIHSGKTGNAFQWMNSSNPYLSGRKPIDMIDDRAAAQDILSMVKEELRRRQAK